MEPWQHDPWKSDRPEYGPLAPSKILRTERGLAQRELAARVTALGRPMTNTMLSRIERAQRRCDIDDLVALAQALRVSPLALLHGIRAA